ncbi:DinB family protein [Paenibacillus sp. 7124]|uniref:DinB family protein n=1 Tax=Paenibacillus apii TaxID=1850370 RepID=A0A6M1PUH1_9BACL|nr:DinB family protein [Paenibacillus apii]NGM85642.1 DinB family protein [Paenibacillus apii]NJJ40434.1 DinB family protein [Paenibacillus apii]
MDWKQTGGHPLDRDLEMSATHGKDVAELLHAWSIVHTQSIDVLSRFTESDLDRLFTEDGLTIPFVLHYCAQHLAFHAGQLVLLRKWFEPSFQLYKDKV